MKVIDLVSGRSVAAVLFACAVSTSALAFVYSAPAIEITVVDADTRKPLDGVIAAANWQLNGGLETGIPVGQVQVLEAISTKEGKIVFPAWGPVFRLHGRLDNRWPHIVLYSKGYRYRLLQNEQKPGNFGDSTWNKKTIGLARAPADLEELRRSVMFLTGSVGYTNTSTDCDWKKVPRLMLALEGLRKSLTDERARGFIHPIEHLPRENQCGDPKGFFDGFDK